MAGSYLEKTLGNGDSDNRDIEQNRTRFFPGKSQ